MLSRWVSVTVESTSLQRTLPILMRYSPILALFVSEHGRLFNVCGGLECYSELVRDHTCALKAAKLFDAVDWCEMCSLREVKLSLLCSGKIGFLFLVPGITDSLCLHLTPVSFSVRVKVAMGARNALNAARTSLQLCKWRGRWARTRKVDY